MSVITPNMNLIESTVGADTGLSWEQNLNSSLTIIDGHNHAAGSGVQINPNGININAELPFNSQAATLVDYVNLVSQGSGITVPTNQSVYSAGGELYWQDGVGNAVKITASGSVNATSSGISSGTASASFVSSILTVLQNVGQGAAVDAASYILRYNGSYPTPSGNAIVLAAPSSLSGSYQLTLPNAAAVSAGSMLTSDTSGNVSYVTPDNSTIAISAGQLVVQTQSLKLYSTGELRLNGPYAAITTPALEVDGYIFFDFNATITAVWIYNNTAGSGGTTEFDLKLATSGGSFSSILSTTGKITSAAASGVWTDSGSVVGAQTGVTKPVLTSANVNAGQAVRMDILQAMTGNAADCGLIIHFVPR